MPVSVVRISTNDLNAVVLKVGSGRLLAVEAFNNGSTIAYLKFWDKASAVDPSAESDAPFKVVGIPHNSGNGAGNNPISEASFNSGLAFVLVTGIANNNEDAPAASEYVLTITFE